MCVKRLDNLVRLKTSPENVNSALLTEEEYGKQRFELLKEKARLEELAGDSGSRIAQWLTTTEKVFEFACSARSRFAAGDAATKKEILAVIGSNLVLKDKKLIIEATKPFLILEHSLAGQQIPENEFEPENIGLDQRQKEPFGSFVPTGLRQRENVRTDVGKWKETVAAIYMFLKETCLHGSTGEEY